MKITLAAIIYLILFPLNSITAQEIIGNSQLSISLQNNFTGMELSSIQSNGTEMLEAHSYLFFLYFTEVSTGDNNTISATSGWGNVDISNNGSYCTVVFSSPSNPGLPDSLTAILSVSVNGAKSQWDLSVSGISDDYTLTRVNFPKFKIKAESNDNFLVPKYSGKSIPNPHANNIDVELNYPRGWSATLPFLSYYNDSYGIYLGYHDPGASTKSFIVKAESNYVKFYGKINIPDKTLAGNDWELPGVFELDLYEGNWYDAAMIYKEWTSAAADYWPQMTQERMQRQNEMGRTGAWGYFEADTAYPMSSIENKFLSFDNFFSGIPTGIHWYRWNYVQFDNDYPDYFPERSGMTEMLEDLHQNSDVYVMPYINGRLYDTDLPDYNTNGYPFSTKDENGDILWQEFSGNIFAVMCPTQTPWQNILIDAADQLTDRIGSDAIYLDQVCAAGPTECMDMAHGHTLGGGHWWRDGYNEMFERIRDSIPAGKFVTVEGGTDYLADDVDGFLTDGWTTTYLVPAFQAIYGGKVQFFGTSTWTSNYHNQSFYCKLSQAFVNNIQPGRFSLWIVFDEDADLARPFVRDIATMRYKLRNFMSFGSMLRPIEIIGAIPDITSTWYEYGDSIDVTISAIQKNIYQSKNGDSVCVVFANALMTDSLSFSFDLMGNDYNLSGDLCVRTITETTDDTVVTMNNGFSLNVGLAPMKSVAYVITPHRIELNLKVFLEGPYNGIDMNTDLNGNPELVEGLPLSQPYNTSPWNYQGTETVDSLPENVVDWVLIELRDTTDAALATAETAIARQAAFLLNDGAITSIDGPPNPAFNHSLINSLFVVIYHRNHLGIMSAEPLTESGCIYSYDFTSASGQAFGTDAQKDLGSGVYGMYSTDANADGTINTTDKTIWENQAGTKGYHSADFDLDGQVNNPDKNENWIPNEGEGSQMPE
jgi:hypothetical protein